MKEFSNTNDILEFAISREQEAVDFYRELAEKATNNYIRETFERFAVEEIGHKTKLLKIKEEKIFIKDQNIVKDLKISDYLDNVSYAVTADLSYQDALVIAMKREKSAFKLYTHLAAKTSDKSLQTIFLQLAAEESKHKLMFEIEYDEFILKDN